MVPPNLRSVVAQGWRSIGSRRNFSSSPGSNGETDIIYDALKAAIYPSFTTFRFSTWSLYGYAVYSGTELYQMIKLFREWDELSGSRIQKLKQELSIQ